MRFYGRLHTVREDPSRCIAEVGERPHYIHFHQCSRKRGHGTDGLFCKQHAKGQVRYPSDTPEEGARER